MTGPNASTATIPGTPMCRMDHRELDHEHDPGASGPVKRGRAERDAFCPNCGLQHRDTTRPFSGRSPDPGCRLHHRGARARASELAGESHPARH